MRLALIFLVAAVASAQTIVIGGGGGSGGGNVNASSTLAANACVTGAGSTDIQTVGSCAIDANGISTGVGGSTRGAMDLGQGTGFAVTIPSNTHRIAAPASIGTSLTQVVTGAAATGIYRGDASGATVTDTNVELSGAVVTSGSNVTTPGVNVAWNVDSSIGTSTGAGFYIPGSSLTAAKLYYFASGGLTLAKADDTSTVPAMCLSISTTACSFSGVYRFASSQSWTAGQLLYVSDASAGALVTTAPSTSGHYVQRVGVALAADTMLILISPDVGGIQ